MKSMKPCDCEDIHDVAKLKEREVCFNNWTLKAKPLGVIISNPQFSIKIPQHYFKYFAEWYLKDQK